MLGSSSVRRVVSLKPGVAVSRHFDILFGVHSSTSLTVSALPIELS